MSMTTAPSSRTHHLININCLFLRVPSVPFPPNPPIQSSSLSIPVHPASTTSNSLDVLIPLAPDPSSRHSESTIHPPDYRCVGVLSSGGLRTRTRTSDDGRVRYPQIGHFIICLLAFPVPSVGGTARRRCTGHDERWVGVEAYRKREPHIRVR